MAYTDVSEHSKYYDFENTEWLLLDPFGDNRQLTINNVGQHPVIVATTDTPDPIDDEIVHENKIPTLMIGGINYEVSTPVGKYMFVKSPTIETEGTINRILVRTYGTVNPFTDITVLANLVSELEIKQAQHRDNKENPHEVTKAQLGLDFILDDTTLTHTTDDVAENILPSTIVTNIIKEALEDHESHQGNPHMVTKEQLGLANVSNLPIATLDQARDTTNNEVLLTPYSATVLIDLVSQPSSIARAQTVVSGVTGDRISLWSASDMNKPSAIISKYTDYQVTIHGGLQVAFADRGKSRLSAILNDDVIFDIPNVVRTTTYYLYCDIDPLGIINDFGTREDPYIEGFERTSAYGDFYNVGTGTMTDTAEISLRRVYIGRIEVFEGNIINVIPEAIGFRTYVPILENMRKEERLILDSPYTGQCRTTAEIFYNNLWGKTEWNDQTGIIASQSSLDFTKTIVQCGAFGFLSCGMYSGSIFGASFNPIDNLTGIKVRVLYEKIY